MKKIKLIIKDFFPTLKKYVNYLMNVGYKDLFIKTFSCIYLCTYWSFTGFIINYYSVIC